jgi:hypothetical protein
MALLLDEHVHCRVYNCAGAYLHHAMHPAFSSVQPGRTPPMHQHERPVLCISRLQYCICYHTDSNCLTTDFTSSPTEDTKRPSSLSCYDGLAVCILTNGRQVRFEYLANQTLGS